MVAPFRTGYAVSHDGQRFLINTMLAGGDAPAITIVLNWSAGLVP